jgi:hypothetical protein
MINVGKNCTQTFHDDSRRRLLRLLARRNALLAFAASKPLVDYAEQELEEAREAFAVALFAADVTHALRIWDPYARRAIVQLRMRKADLPGEYRQTPFGFGIHLDHKDVVDWYRQTNQKSEDKQEPPSKPGASMHGHPGFTCGGRIKGPSHPLVESFFDKLKKDTAAITLENEKLRNQVRMLSSEGPCESSKKPPLDTLLERLKDAKLRAEVQALSHSTEARVCVDDLEKVFTRLGQIRHYMETHDCDWQQKHPEFCSQLNRLWDRLDMLTIRVKRMRTTAGL